MNQGDNRRGQTPLDFGIGAGVFLVVLVFVLAFIPASLQPFDSGVQEETVNADRVVVNLGSSVLARPGQPYTLDTGCTVLFFGGTGAGPDTYSDCAFGNVPLDQKLGIEDTTPVRVRIVGDPDPTDARDTLCWDDEDAAAAEPGRIVEADNSECATTFAAGSTPSPNAVVSAKRAVNIDGESATLIVEMW